MRIVNLPQFKDRRAVLSTGADATVQQAVQSMVASDVGAIVVLDGERLAGIFTERDLLNKVVDKGLDPKTTPLSRVMTRDVVTARQDDDVDDSLERMARGRFRHLPVVDGGGRVIGMLSQRDFVAISLADALRRTKEAAAAKFAKRYQPGLIAAGVMIYTVVLLSALSA
jgi:CBS domain-containing protein